MMKANGLLVLLVRGQMQMFAIRLTRRFRDLLELDDIRSAVDLALVRAVERYDAEKGPFLPFALIWVRREVHQLIRREIGWRRHRPNLDWLIEASGPADSPHDHAERAQILRLIEGEAHELWRAHVGHGASVRDLASTYGKSIRQVQTDIARSQRRLGRLYGPTRVRAPRRARR